jgi:hypothetical protein
MSGIAEKLTVQRPIEDRSNGGQIDQVLGFGLARQPKGKGQARVVGMSRLSVNSIKS